MSCLLFGEKIERKRVFFFSPETNASHQNAVEKAFENCFRKFSVGMFQHLKICKSFLILILILVIASHSIVVLLISIGIVAALTFGVHYMNVTTNPVEIWASPDSRGRKEKDFYDSIFTPFYRTEQIFIKAVGIKSVRKRSLFPFGNCLQLIEL